MHGTLGFCAWDILGLAALVAAIAVLTVHTSRHKKRRKELEDELSAKMLKKTAEGNLLK